MFKKASATDQDARWAMYAAERSDVYEFLISLSPSQWEHPSLCEGWRNRDVAVHLLVDEPLQKLGAPRALVKALGFRLSVHRINQWWVESNSARPTSSIAAAFDGPWEPGRISQLIGPTIGMRAMVIHHQDMRRPLGMFRVVPEERVVAALNVVLTPRGSVNLGSFERGKGLHLQADDVEWSWGDGPLVTGSAEAILMSVAGRTSALAELSGDGVAELSRRLSPGPVPAD